MSNSHLSNEQDLFDACLALTPPERAELLERACAGDGALKDRVGRLLAAHDRAERETLQPIETLPLDAMPDVIGAYQLIAQIGEGGMGVVYEAEQQQPVRRRVALKIVKLGMDTRQVVARFMAERQALAAMDHPYVAKVIDAGATVLGRPYFVMELVRGEPLLDFCRREHSTLRQRLSLFAAICQAVQHAHQKGVVHRDLKPSNILVSATDGIPAPKIIDFGIAKAVGGDSLEASLEPTRWGQRLGTPAYMSPEQAGGVSDVDTRSDVYSLGVMLYELVTGSLPVDPKSCGVSQFLERLASGAIEPPRPSTKNTNGVRISDDLDFIVMKALEVDRSRRYATALSLAEDIARFLKEEPVAARPSTVAYRAAKFVRRHRGAVASAAAVVLSILAALGVSSHQTAIAVAEGHRATERFNDARHLADVLMFDIHDAVRTLPGSTAVRQKIVVEALKYLERLSRDPANDDSLRLSLARGYRRVGDVQGNPVEANLGDRAGALASYRKGAALVRPLRATPGLGRDASIELASLQLSIARVANVSGDSEETSAAAREAHEIAEEMLVGASDDWEIRRILGRAKLELGIAGGVLESLPELQAAMEIFELLLPKHPDDPALQRDLAVAHKYVGAFYQGQNDSERALEHHARAQQLDEQRLSVDTSNRTTQLDVAIDLSNVANAHWNVGRLVEAAAFYERSLQMRLRIAGADPNDEYARSRVAFAESRLGSVYSELGRHAEALQHAEAAIAISKPQAAIDAAHTELFADELDLLGRIQLRAGDIAAACATFDRAKTVLRPLTAKNNMAPSLEKVIQRDWAQFEEDSLPCAERSGSAPGRSNP